MIRTQKTISLCDGVDLPLNTFLRHVALLGSSGSGKTVAAKVICEELSSLGIPIIAIDPQGDISSLITIADTESVVSHNGDITVYNAFKEGVEVLVWTPASNAGKPIRISPIELDYDGSPIEKVRNISSVAKNLTSLLGFDLAKSRGRITSAFLDIIFTYVVANNIECKTIPELMTIITNPSQRLLEKLGSLLSDKEISTVVKMLITLTTGSAGLLFNMGEPLEIDVLLGKKNNSSGKTRVSIIYLNTLDTQEEKNFFVAQIAMMLYRWMLSNPSTELQALLYIDEIAPFLPPVSKPASKDILRLLFKQARKYGVGCMLATQNPGDVDYRSLSQVSTYFLGRIMTEQDIKKVDQIAKSISPDASAVLNELPRLEAGHFKLMSPSNYNVIKDIRFRWLYTEHLTYDEEDLREIINSDDCDATRDVIEDAEIEIIEEGSIIPVGNIDDVKFKTFIYQKSSGDCVELSYMTYEEMLAKAMYRDFPGQRDAVQRNVDAGMLPNPDWNDDDECEYRYVFIVFNNKIRVFPCWVFDALPIKDPDTYIKHDLFTSLCDVDCIKYFYSRDDIHEFLCGGELFENIVVIKDGDNGRSTFELHHEHGLTEEENDELCSCVLDKDEERFRATRIYRVIEIMYENLTVNDLDVYANPVYNIFMKLNI